jgi:hypothetical protein
MFFLGIDTRKRFTQIFEALRTNRRVKILSIQCGLLGGPTNDDLFKLANSIEVNDTLESLSLRCKNTHSIGHDIDAF